MNLKAVVFAYQEFGVVCLEELLLEGVQVAAVVTHADDPGENVWFRSVAALARDHKIPVIETETVDGPEWVERVASLSPDVIFSFCFRKLIPEAVLKLAPKGAFNLHPSLLPKYRGRCPINWVLVNGEKETGLTLHEMVRRADAGAIVAQDSVSIAVDDDVATLYKKLVPRAPILLRRVLRQIAEGKHPRLPNDDAQASKFGGRGPEDGRVAWEEPAEKIHNMVRAVTHPYPGAFVQTSAGKLYLWASAPARRDYPYGEPGEVVSLDPLTVQTGKGAVELTRLQWEGERELWWEEFAEEYGLKKGASIERRKKAVHKPKKLLILGVNGFIGHHLTQRVLAETDWEIYGMDLGTDRIAQYVSHPRFHFEQGDISQNRKRIEGLVAKCDVILPLVAIATPALYVKEPLKVFELDFEENLKIIRDCVRHKKYLIFPSTSEIYGMCPDDEFDADTSNLVLGPIHAQRWIYSASKQLLDRVIWAYGVKEGLRFTLIRPFNWIGPNLDSLTTSKEGSSRVLTQFVWNMLTGQPLQIVNGGNQRRSFTDISDGVDALMRILSHQGDGCYGQIFNIGNPHSDYSIRELAEQLVKAYKAHPLRPKSLPEPKLVDISQEDYYGPHYQDMAKRKPSIKKTQEVLGWQPKVGLDEALGKILDFYLHEYAEKIAPQQKAAAAKGKKVAA